ncbi:peptidase T [Leuconostoc falkenbergense]|uniref:peptidase T n=1 Tax=Leuconostoc falkenbergense TaxID=2766470 RepID=UPI00027380BE|nr:peptidase T [Leuconostoc falkenbergense]OQJ68695.1 peptidase T [Leuconostoc pseudomesenteroides]CCJ66539.1 Tripeptide aminopeptidase [Leuconostoc pseudomesenteroides 4882]OQJ72573.1 peptidase T [Leuconostoc pseudomesenteroides]OQJ79208.1 peptidase T [Leuconostoc pseudomesenteroides]OQJ81527.1 peptidase T [Leuconostoc pseudomesenteroides]
MTKYPELTDRFLKYVKIDTQSDENSTTVPSSPKEVAFLAELAEELKRIGLENVRTMADGYVFAELSSNIENANIPTIGFIAHVDTADFNGANVKPQIVADYDGQSVIQLGTSGYELNPSEFPSLKKYVGHTLITTDGTTLLGADDKAGDAEIITAAAYLIAHPEIKHGDLRFAFGPDEEIGIGADNFDVAAFGADFAYTMDGGPLGELEWETFNAAAATINIKGRNVHPGTAKDAMINAIQVAFDFHAELPVHDRPEHTEGVEGFWHVISIEGNPESATMRYIVRDHDRTIFETRKQKLMDIAATFNQKFGEDRISVTLNDQYYNMGEVLKNDMKSVELAEEAMKKLNIKPIIEPVRGGTDGSKITFLGLPTPNIFAGGENMHGRFEYVSTTVMEQATDVILEIVTLAAAEK